MWKAYRDEGFPWRRFMFILGIMLMITSSGWTKMRKGPFDWMSYDAFDDIEDRMNAINAQNCKFKPASELRLPADTVAQPPRFNHLRNCPVHPSRTMLVHAHNMALNRAFFYSYIFHALNESSRYFDLPALFYQYFSTAAGISANANDFIGSGVFFENKTAYAIWHWFNVTMPLFGPRAWRLDEFGELSDRVTNIIDYGVEREGNYREKKYKTNQWYDLFLPDWTQVGLDSVRKFFYDIGIKYSSKTGKFESDKYEHKIMYGPPTPSVIAAQYLPVLFTEPYFDCGRSNRWIVSAVAPVVDVPRRYDYWLSNRRRVYVAASTVDVDFLRIDFNPCPSSIDAEDHFPNYFHNVSRCKPSTICEPLYGWGFRRGGYQCMCKPGYRYPPWQNGPFQGIELESATEAEYRNGFDCFPVSLRQAVPVISKTSEAPDTLSNFACGKQKEEDPYFGFLGRPFYAKRTDRAARSVKADVLQSRILNKKLRLFRLANLKEKEIVTQTKYGEEKKKLAVVPRVSYTHTRHIDLEVNHKAQFVPRHKRKASHRKMKRQSFDPEQNDRMMSIIRHKSAVTKDSCHSYEPEELQLSGDVAYNVEALFSSQAKTALRLSHFLCNFMQNTDLYEQHFWRKDRPLNVDQIFGEVLANTMADLKIKGSGVFFDTDKFNGSDGKIRQLFGPYAFRYGEDDYDSVQYRFRAIDYAGYPSTYLDEPWFKNLKEKWHFKTYGLQKHQENIVLRSGLSGKGLPEKLSPFYCKVPSEEDGFWTAPYFDCDGYVDDWIVTYSVPFFGQNSMLTGIEFKGVVIVDVKLDELDINQCPQEFFVPNAFKNTARCHYESTYCSPLPGKKFVTGGYRCECKVGYEYPYNDDGVYFDGQLVEEEFRSKMDGNKRSRYDTLQCRISGAHQIVNNVHITLSLIFWSLAIL